jgi:carbonic anhydrase/acetyltransferase-like protein (isoleucine patch superfamily)
MWVDPLTFLSRCLTKLNSLWAAAVYPFAAKGRKLSLHYTCDLRNPQLMQVGDDVIVHKDVWLHAWPSDGGTQAKTTLQLGSRILVGRRSHISAKNLVSIGDDAIISASVLIQDHGHAYDDVTMPIRLQGIVSGGRIRIGKGSWIGQGAVIVCTDGELVLGENCVVAANAVVTRSALPFSVLSGNPAKVVKQFDPQKGTWVLGSVGRAVEMSAR